MKVAIFGLGYVGTVTAACLATHGHEVWGVEIDPGKVALVDAGRSPIVEPGLDDLVGAAVRAGALHATGDTAAALDGADVSLVCVATPSSAQAGTDLGHLDAVTASLAAALRAGPGDPGRRHVVAVRSTVPPGTVERLGRRLAAALAGTRRRVGVAMCPEFLREGTAIADFFAPPFTVIGAGDDDVAATLTDLLAVPGRPVHAVDPRTAEALKYACNAFHATKVTFANELGRIFRRYGVDSREVMRLFCEDDQLNISPRYLRPGFAFGGSCLPKDLRSLLHLARVANVDLPLLAATLQSNAVCVNDVVDRVVAGDGHTVALLGLSFKPDSDDLRESPSVDVAERLLGKGYEVRIYDPIINPTALTGSNRAYVQTRLPHLRRILTDTAADAVAGADVALVSSVDPAVLAALRAAPPARLIDLDGRLGDDLERLRGYEGVAW